MSTTPTTTPAYDFTVPITAEELREGQDIACGAGYMKTVLHKSMEHRVRPVVRRLPKGLVRMLHLARTRTWINLWLTGNQYMRARPSQRFGLVKHVCEKNPGVHTGMVGLAG